MNVRVKPSTIRKKQKIATYFTRAISLVIGILTFGVVFQSYQISSQLITQEVQRTARQTSMLVQEIFDFRLSLLKIHQDSNATNAELLNAVTQEQIEPIDQYFRMVDQLDPDNTPDIRFISGLNHVLWDDGNAAFFGIESDELKHLSTHMTINSTWQLVRLPSLFETIYALARKTPLVNTQTGELMGYFYVLFVVNNNYNLVEHIRNSSHSQDLILAVGQDVLSTTLNEKSAYTEQDLLLNSNMFNKIGLYSVNRTNLLIDNVTTKLDIYSVHDNHNVVKLKRNFYYSVLFIVIAMVTLSLVLWRWVHKSIWFEIDKLVQFTHNIVDKGAKHTFYGSKIEEFDLFGRALEHTFKRLSEQEKQFENLFNFSSSPTILWGLNGHLIRMNPAAIHVFSQERHIERWATLERLLMPEIEKAKHADTQLDEVMTEIDDRMFHWTISPIVNDGRIASVLTQGQDVTTIAEAEKQSHRARDEAERASAARSDFLARMSHEVRTPLNGILGVAQLLKDNIADEKQREHVGVLCLCSEHLLAVLNDILDFSKIEQNKFKITQTRFSLMETTKVMERIYRPLCEEKGIEFYISMNFEDDTFVLSDQVRLNQIIFNLLNNAVKFTREGKICVSLNLIHTSEKEGEHFHVSVQDTGIGIEHEDVSLIFEPFIQGEATSTREYGGSGLGLSIVKNLVELMGGNITVSSQVGEGSCFEFTIPIDVEHHMIEKQEGTNSSGHLSDSFEHPLEVLLVEDNHTNAYIAKAFCIKFGLNVTWVEEGQQALKMLQNERFDLVLMDNQLPHMDGIEVTHIIKHQLKMEIPVYACTADDSTETQHAFLNAGAEYVLVKPIREENLHAALLYFRKTHWKPSKLTVA